MLLEEMQARCKKARPTTQDEVWAVSPIYCLLNFDKDDFCKLVDTIGLEKWVEAADRWKRLDRAEQELTAKERYLRAKTRLAELETEKAELEQFVTGYDLIVAADGRQPIREEARSCWTLRPYSTARNSTKSLDHTGAAPGSSFSTITGTPTVSYSPASNLRWGNAGRCGMSG